MRHGFKAQAERMAGAARQELGLQPLDRIDPAAYAAHLGVLNLHFAELDVSPEAARQLLVVDNESWSGMTIKKDGIIAVLLNPTHTPERRANTMMHEIAHLLLRHVAVRVDVSAGGILLISDYSENDEGEAGWLAGALLLPRDAIKHHRESGRSNREIARLFGISEALCDWRVRMTGVDVQMRRARARA